MAGTESFDITTGCDLQEVDNAVNQALKEIRQRYDLKDAGVAVDFRRAEAALTITAADEYTLRAAWDVVLGRMVRRNVPVKNLSTGAVQSAGGGTARMEVTLQQGIPTETARAIVKFIKERKLRRVQAAIQADQVRVSSPSRDELQAVIAALREEDFGVELKFGNYRSQ